MKQYVLVLLMIGCGREVHFHEHSTIIEIEDRFPGITQCADDYDEGVTDETEYRECVSEVTGGEIEIDLEPETEPEPTPCKNKGQCKKGKKNEL